MLIFHFFFFFNDTATTEIYTLSLHDALPISSRAAELVDAAYQGLLARAPDEQALGHYSAQLAEHKEDRKSTRLNSSHGYISYAVFCLKKKKYKWDMQCFLCSI